MLSKIAIAVLLSLSSLLGIKNKPEDTKDWKIIHDWEKTEEGYLVFKAENQNIACKCKENPTYFINFPTTIHSSSQVFIGGQIIAITNSPDFSYTKGFYGSIVIPCYQIINYDEPITWKIISYTEYFAWFKYFPKVTNNYPKNNLFGETLNIGTAVILFILCTLYLIIFSYKVPFNEFLSLILSNFFTMIYFISSVIGFTSLKISMFTAHKIADAGLWIGFLFFINLLYLEGLIEKWMNFIYRIFIVLGLSIIIIAKNGDTVQLGTTIPFPFTLMFVLYAVWKLGNRGSLIYKRDLFKLISLMCFLIAFLNDMFIVLGVLDSVPIGGIGIVGSYIFILLSVNERITKTYDERDQLQILTDELKQTNTSLEKTQDELVKSEKMAMMGRAVARIAHELNTPISTAKTSAQSLESKTNDFLTKFNTKNPEKTFQLTKEYYSYIQPIIEVLIISIKRTAKIVSSFKEISAKQTNVIKSEFELKNCINTILSTLEDSLNRKKIRVNLHGNEIKMHNDESLFYQITENLITNAQKYAYDKNGGTIDIEIIEHPNEIILTFKDYGKGIPKENMSKIFDAFFTTGGGTDGTGLGLNIVYRIVTQQLNGKINCESTEGKGTTFTITLNKNQ